MPISNFLHDTYGDAVLSNVTKVSFLRDRSFPKALTDSDNFKQLSAEQASNLRGRLKYIEELTLKVDEWVNDPAEEFSEYLNDVELDLAVNQGAPRGDTVVSAWSIHTSWTFGTSPRQLRGLLSPIVLSALDSNAPSSTCSAEELVSWIGVQCAAIKEALDRFYDVSTYPDVIAQLIALDVLVANLLLASYRARLNSALPR